MFLFVVLSPKSLKFLRTACLTGSSGSNKRTTSSVFLLEKESGEKIELAILSLLNTLVWMQSLALGSPSATGCWKVGRINMHLAIHMLFLFASITSHYERQGHGLGGPFDLTYVAILTLFICGGDRRTQNQAQCSFLHI